MAELFELPAPVRRGPPARRGRSRVLLIPVVLLALALVVIEVAPPSAQPTMIRSAIVLAGLAAAAVLLRRLAAVTRSAPGQFEEVLRKEPTSPAIIPGLLAIDQTLRMATASGFGVAFMLRPLVLELARWRLLRGHRIDLGATPELARQVLGEPIWRLIRARDATAAWSEPGIRLTEIRTAVDDLERL